MTGASDPHDWQNRLTDPPIRVTRFGTVWHGPQARPAVSEAPAGKCPIRATRPPPAPLDPDKSRRRSRQWANVQCGALEGFSYAQNTECHSLRAVDGKLQSCNRAARSNPFSMPIELEQSTSKSSRSRFFTARRWGTAKNCALWQARTIGRQCVASLNYCRTQNRNGERLPTATLLMGNGAVQKWSRSCVVAQKQFVPIIKRILAKGRSRIRRKSRTTEDRSRETTSESRCLRFSKKAYEPPCPFCRSTIFHLASTA